MISTYGEPDADILTNALASHIAEGNPQKAVDKYHNMASDVGETYDLLFNKSCAEIAMKDYDDAASSLQTAKDLCSSSMNEDGSSQEEIDKECAPMLLQSLFLGIMTGKTQGSVETCKLIMKQYSNLLELKAVAANNLAVLRGDRDLPDSLRRFRSSINAASEEKLTAYQLLEIRYNRCVLLLHMKKVDECFRALDDLDRE